MMKRAVAALLLSLIATSTFAQWKPSKPVRMLLPFAPGGSAEASARSYADFLRERLGQPFVVESRPGGGQLIAADATAKSPPDGHTVMFASATLVTSPILLNTPFDATKDLTPVIHGHENLLVLATNSAIPAATVAEFVRYARANPGKTSYGFAGNGSSMHLAGELFKSRASIDMVAVPYKGSALLLPDLLAGRVPVTIDTFTTVRPHVDAGKIRILATLSATRVPFLQNVPTMEESGFPNFSVSPWSGFFLPPGAPREILMTYNRELNAALKAPGFAEFLAKSSGAVGVGGTPEQFTQRLNDDRKQFATIIRDANIKAE